MCDPHGATGYQAANTYLKDHPGCKGIFLETAHPAKFKESVEEVIGSPVKIPERLAAFAELKKQSTLLEGDYKEFKNYLISQ